MPKDNPPTTNEVRERILATATELFYQQGIRAVGVDLVVQQAGVAKTSLYRHFRTKDDLVVAFLEHMDREFWKTWDTVAAQHPDDARGELQAHVDWIADRVEKLDYRGCPQLNIAAEFPQIDHPARLVAQAHKRELRRRLKALAERLGCAEPNEVAGQLAVLLNGAFVSTPMYEPGETRSLLQHASNALIVAQSQS
ncbi:TetR/AcrR family transcriptional regulator [Anatilimnocola floriformis]|uniref:TetR/AcrR family transcriptional regulator n=1 Tax=Anatilimnocola floriformis TaxID=2948575 RepID=UPI0020C1DCDF|nr:TetR/AcrR family transcriptional regulator [Anatilimnocola floriformis]